MMEPALAEGIVPEEAVTNEEPDGGRQSSSESASNSNVGVAATTIPATPTVFPPPMQPAEVQIIDLSSGSEADDDDEIVFCGMKKFSPKKTKPESKYRDSLKRMDGTVASSSMGNSQRNFPSAANPRRPKNLHSVESNTQESIYSGRSKFQNDPLLPIFGLEAGHRDRDRTSLGFSEKSTSSFSSFASVDYRTLRPPEPASSVSRMLPPHCPLPQELTPSSSGNAHPAGGSPSNEKYAFFKFGFSTADWDKHVLSADACPTDWTTMTRKEIIAAATKSKKAKIILKALILKKKLHLTMAEKRHLRTLNMDLTPRAPESARAVKVLRLVGLDSFQQPPLSPGKKKKNAEGQDSTNGGNTGRKKKKNVLREETEAFPMLRPTDLRFQITPGFQQPLSSESSFQQPLGSESSFREPLNSVSSFQQPLSSASSFQQPLNSAFISLDDFSLDAVPLAVVEPRLLDHQIIKLTEHSYWLLLTQKPIVVTGLARVQCFAGILEIAGYQCKPGAQVVVPSLDCESWLSIYGTGDPVTPTEFEEAAAKSFDRMDFERCTSTLKRFFGHFKAVLLLTSTNLISDPVIWHSLKLFPTLLPQVARDSGDNQADRTQLWGQHIRPFPACRIIADDPLSDRKPYVPYLDFQKDLWKCIAAELKALPDFPAPVILLCGGKNVGKSTTVRYAINHLLRKYPVVQCLDCDIGQSEFNPPGCLSIHTLTEPVFGPPFIRSRQPTVSCFLGEVSPSAVAEHYRKSLDFVYSTGRRADLPLVVNTMGWVEKLGLDLLKKISDLVRANLIIELTQQEYPTVSALLPKSLGCRTVTLASGAAFDSLKKTWTPAAKRKMALMMYLSGISPTFGSLNDCIPFVVSLSDVSLYFTEKIPPSYFLAVLVGAFVGLAHREDADGQAGSSGLERHGPISLLRNPNLCRNLGFALVRSVDPVRRLLYLLTPLSEPHLRTVNVLIRGSVTTPDDIFLNQDLRMYSGPVPKVQKKFAPASSSSDTMRK